LAGILEQIRQMDPAKVGQAVLSKEKKIENTIKAAQAEIAEIMLQITELQQHDNKTVAHIQVEKQVHTNVTIAIDGVVHRVQSETGPQHLFREEGELVNKE
tara:strand:+ start:51449 stop:51751 length:303 start_codon:yes stop_codon:yes gene_type:complete